MLIITVMSLYQSTGFIIILKFIKFPFIWCPICTEWVPTKIATDDFTLSDIRALKEGCPRSPVRQGGCVSHCSTYRTPELIWHMFRCTLHSYYCDILEVVSDNPGFVEEATERVEDGVLGFGSSLWRYWTATGCRIPV